MKKYILSLFLMMAAVMTYAQQTTVEGARLLDNTSVTIYAGGMGWLNPSVTNSGTFVDGVRPNLGVAVNKWITPAFGAELFFENSANSFPLGWMTQRNYVNLVNYYDNTVFAHRKTVSDVMNLGLNAQVNLNNLLFRYDGEPDFVEFVPFAGMGWMHGWTSNPASTISTPMYQTGDHTANFITANMGLGVNFNLGENKAWQVNVRPAITYALAGEGNNVQFNVNRAYTSLNVGLTYKFGYRNSTGAKTHNFTKAHTRAEFNDIRTMYDSLMVAYRKKPEVVEVEKWTEKVVEKEVVKEVKTIPAPHFHQGKAVLDPTTVALLTELAADVDSNSDKYVVTGYASEEGSSAFNEALSLRRANAIKDFLVSCGVAENRLEVVAGGETTKFGPTLEANRVVTVEKK